MNAMASRVIVALALLFAGAAWGGETKLLPWQEWLEVPIKEQSKALDGLVGERWESSGGKEGTLSLSKEAGPWGGAYLEFHVKIDHFNEGKYPQGWPACQLKAATPLDWSGYDQVRFWIRAESAINRALPIRFILHTDGKGVLNQPLPPFHTGEWKEVSFPIRDLPNIGKVTLVHFFLCESEYKHGDEVTFQIGGFQLCKVKKEISRLGPNEIAAGLWVGSRADTGDGAVILTQGQASLPVLIVAETGGQSALTADDDLRLRLTEMFTRKEFVKEMKLGEGVAPATVGRLTRALDIGAMNLLPGYYLVTADILRNGASLLGGRVGSDDLYIKRPDETMTYTVLSIRTGMVAWVRDLLHGDIMCRTKIALPHVWDPLDPKTYPQFVKAFALTTGKHTEGNEAGDTGLVLAAEAFRKSGDMVRTRFAEGLLNDSFNHMIEKMQAPSGATITWSNELADEGIGLGGPSEHFGSYDSNQIGEWIRPLAYGIIYYSAIGDDKAMAEKLSGACRKASDYLVAHSVQDSNGIPSVLRHVRLNEAADGSVTQVTYHQEGRQCDVYLGRALSGLAYYAYAMQIAGEKVPENYWPVMDNTVKWSLWKMRPDTGWFDYQCEDVVEGGCHTFLGNIYIGEGLFGCYLADREAGRSEQAAEAARATKLAYRYVTDHCVIRGKKFEYPLEFWVGPYVYWLFTQYEGTIGPDERFRDWLATLDGRWSVERRWMDFLDRGKGGVGRTSTNGMLEVSILGYLGIKEMAELGKPYRLPAVGGR